ncbi:GNAT family N-acetyltransferase [Chenggangzhangella methanolivorans]|uniref:GNAT family N-acetyltransferase n=1 Tax=Chenggangzhangella methanolivorans TaxID=1437009 RepID=A0A9E6UQT1_9HYPH|nr:GNAT family N-acetyltransferase [Chenggangzhangella methanolivorans]QZO01430.1 GNAT family N-acetyltransferase [Chenggangzhangella methanolivorans]
MQADVGARLNAGRTSSRLADLVARVRALIADRSDTAMAKKVAGSAFLIRVVNAGIAFASQILLARWMGQGEYGVYVYVWTWVLLLGGLTTFGLASSPQRFIPEYAERGEDALLRGFLIGSRALATAISTVIAGLGLLGVWLFSAHLENWALVPLYLALVCVPMYVLTDVQDGLARTYNWIDVALAPAYFVRPLLILALLGALSQFDFAPTASTAMAATVVATWATGVAQLWMLERRLKRKVPAGPRTYAPGLWMKVSLPIFMVEGFYLSLAYVDVLILSAFHDPHETAVYYAAVKVMSLVAFVSFSVAAAVAHRFSEYAVTGDQARLSAMVRDAARWTFWPSLAGCVALFALGWPILWLFGPEFTEGYPLLFAIAVGLLARATVGPLERLLNMLNEQNLCAAIYGSAFALNVVLCLAFVPKWGAMGAAIATSITLAVESVVLFWATRRRLGLGALPWGRGPAPAPTPREMTGDAIADVVATPFVVDEPVAAPAAPAGSLRFEMLTPAELGRSRAAWEALAGRALERNVFAEAGFAIAASGLSGSRDVRMAAVWDEASAHPRLVAAVPLAPHRALPLSGGLTSADWDHFGPLGAPLLDRDVAAEAAAALLAGLSAEGASTVLLRFLPEGPAARALMAAAAEAGRAVARVDGHARALLRVGEDEAGLPARKLKELRRQSRRLADQGPVAFRAARAEADVAAAAARFLALEAKGWKGAAGTAMADAPDQRAFFETLLADLARSGDALVLELFAGERLAASGVVLIAGDRGWFYKVAYDETLARLSPGVQLTLELTRLLAEEKRLVEVDSTAVADHPMIDRLWRGRLALSDVLVALDPDAAGMVEGAASAERLRRNLRRRLRDLYRGLKGQGS